MAGWMPNLKSRRKRWRHYRLRTVLVSNILQRLLAPRLSNFGPMYGVMALMMLKRVFMRIYKPIKTSPQE